MVFVPQMTDEGETELTELKVIHSFKKQIKCSSINTNVTKFQDKLNLISLIFYCNIWKPAAAESPRKRECPPVREAWVRMDSDKRGRM